MSPIKSGLAVPARFLRPFLPTLVAVSLVAAACSSSSDEPPGVDKGEHIDDKPKPVEEEPAAGGAAGSPAAGASDAGSPTEEPPGSAGTPATEPEPDPGAAGAGGSPDQPGPPEPTAEFLRGQALAEKNTCATCHQADFGGFTVFPNISPDEATGIGSWTDEEISKAIRTGVDRDGGKICETMQRFPFSDDEMADMIAFLRGLPPVKRAITADCP